MHLLQESHMCSKLSQPNKTFIKIQNLPKICFFWTPLSIKYAAMFLSGWFGYVLLTHNPLVQSHLSVTLGNSNNHQKGMESELFVQLIEHLYILKGHIRKFKLTQKLKGWFNLIMQYGSTFFCMLSVRPLKPFPPFWSWRAKILHKDFSYWCEKSTDPDFWNLVKELRNGCFSELS